MKKPLTTLAAVGLMLSLVACAPNGSTAPVESAPESAPTQSAETPTPTPAPTQREPQRVEFSDSIVAWADIDAVLEADNLPVVLLPAVVGATVTVVGIPSGWESGGEAWAVKMWEEGGSLTITPGTTYDPFHDPKDFVNGGQANGSVYIDGKFAFKITEVRP